MAILVGKQAEIMKLLGQLIALEDDALEAYDAAIDRVKGDLERDALVSFRADHRRHVGEMTALLIDLGGEVIRGGEFKRVLTKGKVVLGSMMGDRALLVAMKTNENDVCLVYERACARDDLPIAVRDLLVRNLSDERRHHAWIAARLSSFAQQAVHH